ncbi:uncharacterized protein Dana_GF27596 [Drosophila ananassae]|uniref:Uncharacterized protein n=1 Tax=Drosophila ananassae TaxID=7217 RepID=A0A0P9AFM7_DROAN|nr:uncharacterized protein Dana_GF27596 [Drosophila ananassae]
MTISDSRSSGNVNAIICSKPAPVLLVNGLPITFLGSEESILEYQPDPPEGVTALAATASAPATESGGSAPAPSRALADLIHSRDFVIDFPRVFVLDSGSVVGARDVLFPERLPERSQSSLSLRQARDWMSLMSNKLEEQQGLRRLRKDEMQQQLLTARDSARHRRSRSADGRYSTGCFGGRQRQATAPGQPQLHSQLQPQPQLQPDATQLRRTSSTQALQQLTDASYAQSRQRQRETFDFARTRRRFMRRESDEISLRSLPRRGAGAGNAPPPPPPQRGREVAGGAAPSNDQVTIQINGEGVDLNE